MKKFTKNITSLLSTVLIVSAGTASLTGCQDDMYRTEGTATCLDTEIYEPEKQTSESGTVKNDSDKEIKDLSDTDKYISNTDNSNKSIKESSYSDDTLSYKTDSSGFSFEYLDDSIPSTRYDFKYNSEKGTLSRNTTVYPSTTDASYQLEDSIEIGSSEYEKMILSVIEKDVFDSECVGLFASLLDDLFDIQQDPESIETEKKDHEEYWENLYAEYDTNNDGIITCGERWFSMMSVIEQTLAGNSGNVSDNME